MNFIPIAIPYIGDTEAQAVKDQIDSGWISMGKRVAEFEALIAEKCGVKHAIAFNSGTATLHATLLAMGVGPGDEVLVPVLSYISSANAVLYCGAKPVFVEEDPDTFTVSADTFEKAISPKTKVIMPVDLKGMSCHYEAITEMACNKGVKVLADSAEALGAHYKSEVVGGQADAHSFSMFANKNITTGEGGMVTTNDDQIAEVCRCVRNQGQSERYVHVMLGHNYRMTDIVAAFGIEQFKRVDWLMEQKHKIAQQYNTLFAGHELVTVPHLPDYATRHTWYMYCLRLHASVDRDKMAILMRERNVDHRVSFPPIHLQPYYRQTFGYKEGDFPKAENIYKSMIDIPCWYGLSNEQIEYVADTVKRCAEQASAVGV